MFGNNEVQDKNKIIDGDFTPDRYITVLIDGQVHSRKVKQDKEVAYITINEKMYTAEDFA